MGIINIQNMFAEMGLATKEQREKYAKELSVDNEKSQSLGIETKVSNNTIINIEYHA